MGATVWFLTSNQGKLDEAAHHFSRVGIKVRALNVDSEVVVEPQAEDLETVARAKIQQALQHLPEGETTVMVEDAGLFIDALGGFPGVYSSYVHDTIGNLGIVRLLHHLTSEDPVRAKRLRAASFKAVAALWDGDQLIVGKGVCRGSIASNAQGENGFGYDPIFIPADLDEDGASLDPETLGVVSTHGRTFGSVDVSEKHLFSHRRRAIEDLVRQMPLLNDGE